MATSVGYQINREGIACKETPAEVLRKLFPTYGVGSYLGFSRRDEEHPEGVGHLLNGEFRRLPNYALWIREIPETGVKTGSGITTTTKVTGTLADLCGELQSRDRAQCPPNDPYAHLREPFQIWREPLTPTQIQWYVFRNVVDAHQRDPRYYADRRTTETPVGRFAEALLGEVPTQFNELLARSSEKLSRLGGIQRPVGVKNPQQGDPFQDYGVPIKLRRVG